MTVYVGRSRPVWQCVYQTIELCDSVCCQVTACVTVCVSDHWVMWQCMLAGHVPCVTVCISDRWVMWQCMLAGCGFCDSVCKSVTLARATDSVDVISGECRALVRSVSFDPSDLRGVRSHSYCLCRAYVVTVIMQQLRQCSAMPLVPIRICYFVSTINQRCSLMLYYIILDHCSSLRLSPHLCLVVNHAVNSTDVLFNLVFFLFHIAIYRLWCFDAVALVTGRALGW